MAETRSLEIREKKELTRKEEQTIPARYYVPAADIFESEDALTVVMEMLGVDRKDVDIRVENDALRVEGGRIDFSKYEGLEPVYTHHLTRPVAVSKPKAKEEPNAVPSTS